MQQRKKEKVFFSESRKFSGERRAHRRKLPKGMQPSKTQLIMAEASGVYLPEGHTFVRKSIWGEKKMNERQIKYRTKFVKITLILFSYYIQRVWTNFLTQ